MARQFFNLAEVMGQVDNARLRDQQIKASEFEMQQQQREFERQQRQQADIDAQREAFRNSFETVDGKTVPNENTLVENLRQRNPEMAYKLLQDIETRKLNAGKLRNESEKIELENRVNKATYVRDRIATAGDQQSYEAVMQELSDIAPDLVRTAPPEFNPNWIKQQVMTADKFLESQKVKPPTSRTIQRGTEKITQEFNEQTGQFEDIASGPAYAPPKIDPTVTPDGYSRKPIPATALKMQNEALDKLAISSNNNEKLGEVVKQIETGKLNLGLFSNLAAKGKNFAGYSDESSRNLSSFKSTLEKLRNDSLRLNTGVQTDGDAQRAWNELFENINDAELVKQRLKEIQEINLRGADLQKLQVENIRGNYNAEPIDFSRYERNNQNIMPKDEQMPKGYNGKAPPIKFPNARRAPDGNWYVKKPGGGYQMVTQ